MTVVSAPAMADKIYELMTRHSDERMAAQDERGKEAAIMTKMMDAMEKYEAKRHEKEAANEKGTVAMARQAIAKRIAAPQAVEESTKNRKDNYFNSFET